MVGGKERVRKEWPRFKPLRQERRAKE